jgi:hypothetical protein
VGVWVACACLCVAERGEKKRNPPVVRDVKCVWVRVCACLCEEERPVVRDVVCVWVCG